MMSKSNTPPQKRAFAVTGMTCRSCELMVERQLQKLPSIATAQANLAKNEVEITAKGAVFPSLERLNTTLNDTQYRLSQLGESIAAAPASKNDLLHWVEVGLTLAVLLVLSRMLQSLDLLPQTGSLEGFVGYTSIFVIGLAAASSSCLALVGGLLLSVSAKWVQSHPTASGWQKLQPLLLFNVGRLIGYFFLGGLAGLVGMAFGLSAYLTGLLTVALAMVMLILGGNILGIIPKRYCTIPLPRSMMQRIQGLSASKNPAMPIVLGALTFFVPCGFTQSMQLLALGSGSFLAGGLIMFTFALGTLPALLGISVLGAYVRGELARWFLIIAGSTTVLLGLANLQSGLVLLNVDVQDFIAQSFQGTKAQVMEDDPFVTIDAEGRQVVSLYVRDQGYQPENFTVSADKPTWIYAIAPDGVSGCASLMTLPSRNLQTMVQKGDNWIGPFTPKAGENILISCSMGMLTAHIRVL
jgi:sulfite exporter TauE/SafE/copper chaperone CopZ